MMNDMARRRFFVPHVRRGFAELTGVDAEHLVRVLRVEADQLYEISDNEDLYLARITTARKSAVSFEVVEKLAKPRLFGKLTLVAALFKFDHFEWMLEKATELGVEVVAPFEACRSDRGLKQAAVKRHARWERIVLEASQQARRVHLPVVLEATGFEQALETNAQNRILLDENASTPPILSVLPPQVRQVETKSHVALLVGPEGGWTDSERHQAIEKGWLSCSLGGTILRAETAALAGLSIVRAWLDCAGAPPNEVQAPLT
jgi:16S rRNA (uracil1498-N3)-methyltransferase